MIKLNRLTKVIGTAALLIGANVALAETVTVPASVTVNNAIDFTFTGQLDFGQVRATADVTDLNCNGLLMPANPASAITAQVPAACTGGAGVAVLQTIGGTPSRPVFTVAGTAPFSTMNLTVPFVAVPVTAATGPNTPQFFLSGFNAYRTGTSPAVIAIDQTDGTGSFITNASGGATFTVGAVLGTNVGVSTANYQDLAYTGSFDVEVTY